MFCFRKNPLYSFIHFSKYFFSSFIKRSYVRKLRISIIKHSSSEISSLCKNIFSGIYVLREARIPTRNRFWIGLDHLLFSFSSRRKYLHNYGVPHIIRWIKGNAMEAQLQQPVATTPNRSQREASDWTETGREAGRVRFAMDRIANRIANNERVLFRQNSRRCDLTGT